MIIRTEPIPSDFSMQMRYPSERAICKEDFSVDHFGFSENEVCVHLKINVEPENIFGQKNIPDDAECCYEFCVFMDKKIEDFTSNIIGVRIVEEVFDGKNPCIRRTRRDESWGHEMTISEQKVIFDLITSFIESRMKKNQKTLYRSILRLLPNEPTENCVFWTNGCSVLSDDEQSVNAIADLFDSVGFQAITGYYDPNEDIDAGIIDDCTGYYYVDIG